MQITIAVITSNIIRPPGEGLCFATVLSVIDTRTLISQTAEQRPAISILKVCSYTELVTLYRIFCPLQNFTCQKVQNLALIFDPNRL